MRKLSLSRAWEETRDIFARDGRLYVAVALALMVLPAVINGLVNPKGMGRANAAPLLSLLSIVASLIMLAGQLGIVRLALGPSITVGHAIGHGMRRLPIYFVAALIIVVGLLVLALPFGLVAKAMGVPMTPGGNVAANPTILVLFLLYFAVAAFIGVRLILAAPVASAEAVGPIALLRRSWQLSTGNFWRLFGFVFLFFIAAFVVLVGVGAAAGVAVTIAFGPPHALSVSALILALIQALLSAAFTTFLTIMLTRFYVQLSGNEGHA